MRQVTVALCCFALGSSIAYWSIISEVAFVGWVQSANWKVEERSAGGRKQSKGSWIEACGGATEVTRKAKAIRRGETELRENLQKDRESCAGDHSK